VLETDVEKCFDKISHEFLLKHTPICDKVVLHQWLKSGVFVSGLVEKQEEGTPQGGAISSLLCNIALNGLQAAIQAAVAPQRSNSLCRGINPKVTVVRYADDLVVTGSEK